MDEWLVVGGGGGLVGSWWCLQLFGHGIDAHVRCNDIKSVQKKICDPLVEQPPWSGTTYTSFIYKDSRGDTKGTSLKLVSGVQKLSASA